MLFCAFAGASGQLQARKQVVPAARPPVTALPAAKTKQSTALAAAARTNAPLPKQLSGFTVADADGKTLDIHALAKSQRWLLLYRQPSCAPCDVLMTSLEQDATFKHGSALTVVVAGASASTLARTKAQFPQWSEATWTADSGSSAFKVLKMRGTPMLYGLIGTSIVFAFAGAPGGPEQVTSAASSWVAAGPASTIASASSAASGANR